MQHVYEPLYTSMRSGTSSRCWPKACRLFRPTASTYTITLRKGVKFHNGKEMTADDVVASLTRWMEVSARGKAVAQEGVTVAAKGANAIEIKLKTVYALLLAHLAMPSGMAGIMPKEAQAAQLKDFIGTWALPVQRAQARPVHRAGPF